MKSYDEQRRMMHQSHVKVSCWYGFADEMKANLFEQFFDSMLSAGEKARNERYRHERDRRLHLMARVMIRTLLTSHFPAVSPADWAFDQDIYGKPFISGPIDHRMNHLNFNISHTDGLVAVAISEHGPVGVDVENKGRTADFKGLARRFFAPVEAEMILNADEGSRAERFFRTWTLKEAYVKAIGKGLSHGLDSFWFGDDESNSGFLSDQPRLYLNYDQCGASKPDDRWDCFCYQVGSAPGWIISIVAGRSVEKNFKTECEFQPIGAEFWRLATVRKP